MSVTAKGRVVYQFLKVTNSRPLVSNWSDSTSLYFNPIEIDGFSPSSMPQKIAYIDAQNIYKGIKSLGYDIDRQAFFSYLKIKHQVSKVKYFT